MSGIFIQGLLDCGALSTGSASLRAHGVGRFPRHAARKTTPVSARRWRGWAGRLAWVAASVLAAIGLAVPAASASPGDLAFAGCIGDHAGCTATYPAAALDGANAVAVVGNQVYATSGSPVFPTDTEGDVVSHFTMDLAGNLTFRGCIGHRPGCTATSPATALDGANAIAASPDGRQLYVTSGSGDVVSHFTIDPAGNLSFRGCIGNLPGCTPTNPSNALEWADGVAITSDGRQLYATASFDGVVSHFTIDPAGNLSYADCIGDLTGCSPTYPAEALLGADAVAVTPDGSQLYATSNSENVVSHFTIDPAGNLSFAGCIGDRPGCTATYPASALDGADAVAITSDGRQLYAASDLGNVVSHFTIDSAGNLSFGGCIGDRPGCTPTSPAAALDGADGLAVTADGAHLYAIAGEGNAVSHFTIGPGGDLSFAGCIGGWTGCTPTSPAGALDYAHGLAVTADGAHLYTTSINGRVVSHFKIAGFTAAGG
jgi:6-phosphogluconolactonase (cycloisomerase 2 family)